MAQHQSFLRHYPLHSRIKAFSSMRKGGVSVGQHASFNINPYCGDDEKAVQTNKQLLANTLAIPLHQIVLPHQMHGKEVRIVGKEFLSLSSATQQLLLEGVDSLITNQPHICIGVSTADCIPILLYDPEHHVSAAIHAGWRGTVQRIVQHTIDKMKVSFDSRPSKLLACIGPGISVCHFEVGNEVYEAFAQAGFSMPLISEKHEKWHLNLPECNRLQLVETGVEASNIMLSNICTYKQHYDYFSARRLGTQSGRIYNGILLL